MVCNAHFYPKRLHSQIGFYVDEEEGARKYK